MNKFLTMVLTVAFLAYAARHIVNTNEGAGGDGSNATPWNSLDSLNRTASIAAGDSVLVMADTITRTTPWLMSANSGAYNNRIRIFVVGADTTRGAERMRVYGTGIDHVCSLFTATYISFDGFDFLGSDSSILDGRATLNHMQFINCSFDSSVYSHGVQASTGGATWELTKCNAIGNTLYGIYGITGKIKYCNVSHNSGGGLYAAQEVSGCIVSHNGGSYGIQTQSGVFENNVIDSNATGIYCNNFNTYIDIGMNNITRNYTTGLNLNGRNANVYGNRFAKNADDTASVAEIYELFSNEWGQTTLQYIDTSATRDYNIKVSKDTLCTLGAN